MALTDEQAVYVDQVQDFRHVLGSQVTSAARMLIQHRKQLVDLVEKDAAMHAEVFGKLDGDAGKTLENDLTAVDIAIEAVLGTGLSSQTREQIEASFTPNMP